MNLNMLERLCLWLFIYLWLIIRWILSNVKRRILTFLLLRNCTLVFNKTKTKYLDADYDVYVLGEGELVNDGDGGWANWAVYGYFDPVNSKTIKFHKPPDIPLRKMLDDDDNKNKESS